MRVRSLACACAPKAPHCLPHRGHHRPRDTRLPQTSGGQKNKEKQILSVGAYLTTHSHTHALKEAVESFFFFGHPPHCQSSFFGGGKDVCQSTQTCALQEARGERAWQARWRQYLYFCTFVLVKGRYLYFCTSKGAGAIASIFVRLYC
jgi:hypothetical protein